MTETKVEKIALNRIQPSKTNPRKHFDEAYIAELGESIRQKGIIQPITLRPDWCVGKSDEDVAQVNGNAPTPEFFEIVAGECRYRGAKAAQIDGAPSIVRLLGDKETLEIQLIENIQRKDITPVEEAEAYRRLLEMGHTVETIHQRTGLDRRTIYGKLKIIRAPDFLLEALAKKIVGEVHCEIVGRIPISEMRERAAREILNPGLLVETNEGGLRTIEGPMPMRVAREWVAANYMRSLSGAPFDQKDETLVPPMIEDATGERIGGGACTDCPMRSGNSLLVEGEIKRPDVCMNPRCFAQKCDAYFARLQETALAEGKKLLSDTEAREVFEDDGSLSFASPYVLLSQQPDRAEVSVDVHKIPSWKKLVANLESKPQIAVARDPRGRIVELVDRKLAIEAVNLAAKARSEKSIFDKSPKSGLTKLAANITSTAAATSKNGDDPEPEWKKQDRKNREIAKLNFQITLAGMETLVGAIENRGVVKGFWPAMIETSIDHAGHDGCWLVCKLHKLDPKAKNKLTKLEGVQGAALEYGLSLTSEKEQLSFLVELLISQRVKIYNGGSLGGIRAVDSFKRFAKLYSVNLDVVEKEVKAKLKEKSKPRTKDAKVAKGTPEKPVVVSKSAGKPAEHKFEHIVDNKYRCSGCGAAAVKQGKEIIVAKQFRGKPCSRSEAPPKLRTRKLPNKSKAKKAGVKKKGSVK